MVALAERSDRRDETSRESTEKKTVVIDLVGAGELSSARAVQRAVGRALAFARCSVTGASLKRMPKTGAISGTVTFGTGRVSVEAWPATGYVAIDVSGGTIRPEIALTAFADAFDAREAVVKKARRAGEAARHKKLPAVEAGMVRKAA
ncbi:MAG: S-adenosylmethionine decarboxylase [Hyphomicrobium sp.]|nr:S-adenosylmethionine decarboxylase [Hyphomicrobium sp.]